MSESVTDSGHDTTSLTESSLSGGLIPPLTSSNKIAEKSNPFQTDGDILPQLPSHKFRYSVWHDLRETCLRGDQLHAPRVRAGPPEKEKMFFKIEQEGIPIHHNYAGKERLHHSNQQENWERARVVNLSYQELQDDYQRRNMLRILSRCVMAHTINLSQNTLYYLGKMTFPSCLHININDNYLKSFLGFPTLPKVESITAKNNAISDIRGLHRLQGTPLQELDLRGNPLAFNMGYRNMVFHALPNLRVLDGIPRMPSDEVAVDYVEDKEGKCNIL
ncbi:uncharacterized protein LOC128246557 [Mya arenaria]|uniref:uncharacterized protein LOC128246557 n=1 Tax=Mya arenaria TaxID=6604 RepID=UPI0022DEA9FE|nr:uncharacterized protein LOC128246557 [Mya arenaria]